MSTTLKALIVEDSESDARLIVRRLEQSNYSVEWERVETAEAVRAALDRQSWDLVLSDYALPSFSAPLALEVVRASGQDLPFIIISGTIGEEVAVACLKAGAHDFMVKNQLARLAPAVERELREVRIRRQDRERIRRIADLEREKLLLLDVTSQGIVGVDCEWRCTFMNPAASAMLQVTFDLSAGQPLDQLVRSGPHEVDGQRYADLDPAITRRGYTDRFRRADGTTFPVECSRYPIVDEQILRGAVLVFDDVTERVRRQHELQLHTKELEIFCQLAVGRELRMIQLKAEVNGLCRRLGESARYEEEELASDVADTIPAEDGLAFKRVGDVR